MKSTSSIKPANVTSAEKELIETIDTRTRQLNVNNVTRTQAYYAFYRKHPEVEWALLGHLVSRNGGWNMTDLKGEFLSKLLSEEEQFQFFTFLERGNWLIFQDVYPQFLLYEESLKRNTPLFYLLPAFHVSTFMETIWNHFWHNNIRYFLAMALIINEQNYLEKRVIQNTHYQATVLHTIKFKLQDQLSLNHILFPYENSTGTEPKLLGQTLHQFSSLDERVKLGQRLYALLFSDQKRLKQIVQWADSNPHTGSRKDFWSHLFNDVKESLPGLLYRPRTRRCKLKKNAHRLYSPRLEFAWKDMEHKEPDREDWFTDWRITDYLQDPDQQVNGEIKHEYCETIEKIEMPVFTKKAIFHWEK